MNLTPSVHGSVRRRTAVLALAGLLVLAACGGDDDVAAVSTTVPPTSSAVDTTTPTTEPTTTPPSTAPATAAPTTAAPTVPTTAAPTTPAPTTAPPTTAPPSGAECLVGQWVVSDATLDAYFEVVAKQAAFDSIENDGVIRFSFADDTYVRELDTTVTMTVDGSEYVAVHTVAAQQRYAVVDGRLTATGPIGYVGETTFTKDGEPFTDDPGDLFVGILPLADVDAMTFSCDGPSLIVTAGPNPDVTYRLPLEAA